MYVRAVVRWLLFGGAPGHVDSALLARYLAQRRQKCAQASINMEIKALRAFYRHQANWDAVPPDHVNRLPRQRKPPRKLPRYFTDDQIAAIFDACPDTFVGRRDRAILMTLYATGMRAGELAGMAIGDFIDGDLLYIAGKGGRDRYVPVGATLGPALMGYLADRATTRPGKLSAFWLRADGRALRNGRSIWEIVSKRIWQALGLRSGLHRVSRGGKPWTGHFPHEMRSSCATSLLHNGMPLAAVAELLGHADMATTALYIGVDIDHLRRAAAHHPRALRTTPGASGSLASSDMKRLNVPRSKSLDDDTPTAPRRRR